MAALAKKQTTEHVAAWRGKSRPRVAHEADTPQGSAVHAQHALLEAAFTEAEVAPYSGPVKLAILIGAPAALWIGLFVIGARILHG